MATPTNVERYTGQATESSSRAAGSNSVPKPGGDKKKLPETKTGKTKVPVGTGKEGKGDGPGGTPKAGTA